MPTALGSVLPGGFATEASSGPSDQQTSDYGYAQESEPSRVPGCTLGREWVS